MFAEMIALLGMTLVYAVRDSVETIVVVDSTLSESTDVKHAASENQLSWWGTTRVIKREDVSRLPVRGVQPYILLNPGVVEQDGNLHVRGGRPDEIGYMIEGVSTGNVLTGQTQTTVIPEALEEVQFQPGVYSARFGLANSGLVNQKFRTGDSVFHANLSIETDNFTPQYEQRLGTYSYGYSNYVLTLSGPVIDDRVRLFLAAENRFDRDFGVQFLEGFSFSNLRNSNSLTDTLVPSLELKPGNMPGQMRNRYTANGTLTFDAELLKLRFTGAFSSQRQQGTMLPVEDIFNLRRQPITRASDLFLKLIADYALANNVSLNATVFYGDNRSKTFDPDHGDDYLMYEDSVANARLGYPMRTRVSEPFSLFLHGFTFNAFGTNATRFEKGVQRKYGAGVAAAMTLGSYWFSAGGSIELHHLRYFASGSAFHNLLIQNPSFSQLPKDVFNSWAATYGKVVNYGYDVFGSEIDEDGASAPRRPSFGSLFVEGTTTFSSVTVSAGLRFDVLRLDDSGSISISPAAKTNSFKFICPRVQILVAVFDDLELFSRVGRFVQPPPLDMIYNIGDLSALFLQSAGRNFIFPGSEGYQPAQTLQFEIGATYKMSTVGTVSLTGFLKRTVNQFGITSVTIVGGSTSETYHLPYTEGAARQQGVELSASLDPVAGLTAFASYCLTNSESDPGSVPTSFSHLHRAVVSVGYLLDDKCGSVLSDVGVSTLLTFQSGHPFTPIGFVASHADPQDAGVLDSDPRLRGLLNQSSTPSTMTCDLRVDKAISIGGFDLGCFIYAQNLFNTKNEVNVYRTSGSADDNGFLSNPNVSSPYVNALGPRYVELYRAINLQNGQAYRRATGTGLWGSPRQIRFGVRVDV